jgi:hypothetical protein
MYIILATPSELGSYIHFSSTLPASSMDFYGHAVAFVLPITIACM